MRKTSLLVLFLMTTLGAGTPVIAGTTDAAFTPDGDGPPQYATIEVKGVGTKYAEVVDGVEVVVTNLMAVPMNVELDLTTIGLVGRTAVRDIGSFELKGDASTSVFVAATEMPILSAVTTTEAYVEATVFFELSGAVTEATEISSGFYYRSSPDFLQMMTGSEQVAIDDFGGILWGVGATKKDGAFDGVDDDGLLGVVQDDFGTETLVGKDEAFVDLYQDGQYIGRIVGAGVENGVSGTVQPIDEKQVAIESIGDPPATLLFNPWPKIRFCGKWRVSYQDANMGEDFLPYSSLTYVPAKYTVAAVYGWDEEESEWFKIWPVGYDWGVLGTDGCMSQADAIPVNTASEYRMVMGTWATDGYNNVISLKETTTPGWSDDGFSAYPSYYTVPAFYLQCPTPTQCYWTPDMQVASTSRQVHGAAVAGYVIQRRVETGYNPVVGPPGVKTRLYFWDDDLHCTGSYYAGGGNVCIAGSGTSYKSKFTIGHEIGHRAADYHDGPYPANMDGSGNKYFEGEEGSCDGMCRCDFMGDLCEGNDGMYCYHCLQSRENTAVGQGEGYAYLFATWLFNYLNAGAKLVYGKWVWADPLEPPQPGPYAVDAASNVRWMETHCTDVMENNGTEWDWVNFFANVYVTKDSGAPESVRYSMEQINDIWDGSDDAHWSNLLDEVAIQFGYPSQKYNQFYNRAGDAGVRH